jgi:hypothetical protein
VDGISLRVPAPIGHGYSRSSSIAKRPLRIVMHQSVLIYLEEAAVVVSIFVSSPCARIQIAVDVETRN